MNAAHPAPIVRDGIKRLEQEGRLTVKVDLTNDNPITPDMVSAVCAAFDEERRSGDDRRGCRGGGRRAIDRMQATCAEIDRFAHLTDSELVVA